MWFSIGDMYTMLGLGNREALAWRWVHKGFAKWKSYLFRECGLTDWHIRESASAQDIASDRRVLTFPSLSTMALLGVLLRLTTLPRPQGGMADPESKTKLTACMLALIMRGTTEEGEFAIGLGRRKDTEWFPPCSYVVEKDPVRIKLQHGNIIMSVEDCKRMCAVLKCPMRELFLVNSLTRIRTGS